MAVVFSPAMQKMANALAHPLKQRLFLFTKLPAAWFMGVRVDLVTTEAVKVSVPYGWSSKNPFRSTYFAALAAAAEMSTGVIGLLALRDKGSVSILVQDIRGEFYKKAVTRSTFTCADMDKVFNAVQEAIDTSEARTVTCESTGVQENGETVAKFWVTWTFKKRKG